jgi:hypothetical protein
VNVHDADDISLLDRFKICSEFLDEADVIYHDTYVYGYHGFEKRIAGEWDRERYKRVNYICASSILVRTEIAKKVKWQTNTFGQDWIWLNLIAEITDRFIYIPKPLLIYRNDTGFTNHLKFKSVRRILLKRRLKKELYGTPPK